MLNDRLITEKDSLYDNLEKMDIPTILKSMNDEDQKVAFRVADALPKVAMLTKNVVKVLRKGGRVFTLGSGTSGRLCVVDASEIPPTFGAPFDLFIGIIAGGDGAIRKAVEGAEDSTKGGYKDLRVYKVSKKDIVIGVAASGTTPYVVHALKKCQKKGIATGCITSNPGSPITQYADVAIEVVLDPEFLTGSSRLKSGTAQKLILNMISTAAMIKMGTVEGNKMVKMKMSNKKLVERGIRTTMTLSGCSRKKCIKFLKKNNYVISDALRDLRS